MRHLIRTLRILARLLEPDKNPSGAVYGTITAGALLAADVGRDETFLDDVLAVAVALVLYWLAHAYADALGERLEGGRTLSVSQLARHLSSTATMLRGAGIPVVVLLASRAIGASASVAVLAALISAAATLVLLETVAAARQRLALPELLLQVGVGVMLGAGVLAVRVVLR